MHIDPAWVAAGLMFVVSAGGWGITAIRNGKSQARRFGNLEGKFEEGMKGMNERLNGVETSVNNLGQRIDNFVDGFDGRGRRSKKP